MWFVLGTALAASPGGYELGTGLPESTADIRNVLVVDGAGGWVGQSTLRGQVAWRHTAAVTLEFPVVLAGFERRTLAGPGRVEFGYMQRISRYHDENQVRVGFETSISLDEEPVPAWGSHSRETQGGMDLAGVIEAAGPPGATRGIGRLALGLGTAEPTTPVYAQVAACGVATIRSSIAVVAEGVLVSDPLPFVARLGARWSNADDSGSADLGVQVGTNGLTFSMGPVLAARYRF